MSGYPCELIEDLIPLYIEDVLSAESRSIVKQHINECADCLKLINEYSVQEVLPQDLPENLPQVDTFKSTMKRLRIWSLYVLLAISIIGIAIAGLSYHLGSTSGQDLLSVKQVVTYFAQEGLKLKTDNDNPYAGEEINGVKPVGFTIDKSEDQVLIYEYKDFDTRKDAARQWKKKGAEDGLSGFMGFDEPTLYGARNILIIYAAGSDEPTIEDVERAGKVKKVVFYQLNNARKIVFAGEGQYWQGKLTVDYYENWLRKDDKLEYDQYHFTKPELTYKGSDSLNGAVVTYNFNTPGGMTGGTIEWPDDNKRVLGTGGGNGSFSRENKALSVTVKWNGQVETFELNAIEQK